MCPKTPRPPTLGVERAGNSKGLAGTFDPQTSETPNRQQGSRNALPVNTAAVTRYVPSSQDADRLVATLRDMAALAHNLVGPCAFDCPKSSAALHEAGHALMHTLDGKLPERASIWPIRELGRVQWVGRTDSPRWRVDGWTPPEADLKRARSLIAGVVAEMLFDPEYRLGSSLDEIVIAQSIVRTAAIKMRRDPKVVWLRTLAEVASRLKAHECLVHEIADELMRKGRIKTRRLTRLLQTVGGTHECPDL
jgi:hypothetical protein